MCTCGKCKDCDPSNWIKERRTEVGEIGFHENNLPGVFKQYDPFPVLVTVPLDTLTEKISLRDQMAMAALQGILARDEPPYDPKSEISEQCYFYADAMLKAREKK